jgi:hypothetical protein
MSEPHLVIAAFWSVEPPDEATSHVMDAIGPYGIKGSGAVVSVKGVDWRLRQWLRTVDIAEAGDWPPTEAAT